MPKIMTNKQSPLDALGSAADANGLGNKKNPKAAPKGGYEPVSFDRGMGAECISTGKYKEVGKI